MSSLRQVGSGLLYALVSVVLVVGGLSLALAEGSTTTVPSPSPIPSSTVVIPTLTMTLTAQVVEPSGTSTTAPSITPQVLFITATPMVVPSPTRTPASLPAATWTTRPPVSPTIWVCGPYTGWLKSYTVQAGDTLYHIATLYRTTVTALQTANCKRTTIIYAGELLWVPNAPTVTPGVTIIPTFPTSTEAPTLTPEWLYLTQTAAPLQTAISDP